MNQVKIREDYNKYNKLYITLSLLPLISSTILYRHYLLVSLVNIYSVLITSHNTVNYYCII